MTAPVGPGRGAPVAPADLDERVHRRLLGDGVVEVPGAGALRGRVEALVRAEAPLLGASAVAGAVDRVVAAAAGLGPLEPVLADPDVTDVLVNGPGPVWVERLGSIRPTDLALDRPTIDHLVEKIVAPLGLRADRTAPLVDARLLDGSRVHVVLPPLAVDGPYVTIRRFAARPFALDAFCSAAVAALLVDAVRGRRNVVVAGGTGSGKTTLLNALAAHLPRAERVVTIEDAAELRLPGNHVVRLEARPPNAEGAGGVDIRTLVRNALRMRPDRIVVGEVRGAEALDMVQAMNTGHEGSLSTCHANGPADALRRLETMVLLAGVGLPLPAVREQLASAVDLVVQVARTGTGRAVVAVAEVVAPGGDGGLDVRMLATRDRVVAAPSRPDRGA